MSCVTPLCCHPPEFTQNGSLLLATTSKPYCPSHWSKALTLKLSHNGFQDTHRNPLPSLKADAFPLDAPHLKHETHSLDATQGKLLRDDEHALRCSVGMAATGCAGRNLKIRLCSCSCGNRMCQLTRRLRMSVKLNRQVSEHDAHSKEHDLHPRSRSFQGHVEPKLACLHPSHRRSSCPNINLDEPTEARGSSESSDFAWVLQPPQHVKQSLTSHQDPPPKMDRADTLQSSTQFGREMSHVSVHTNSVRWSGPCVCPHKERWMEWPMTRATTPTLNVP